MIERLWVSHDEGPYRAFNTPELIDVTVVPFPTFNTIPNELPSQTRTRWRTEYMDLAARQHDYLQHLLCRVYVGCAEDPHQELSVQGLNKVLKYLGDVYLAEKRLQVFHSEAFLSPPGIWPSQPEIITHYAVISGTPGHKIHVTPIKP